LHEDNQGMPNDSPYLTAALYQFVDLPDYVELQAPLQACCDAHDVKGTLLLAHEGINGTIAGPEVGVRDLNRCCNKYSTLPPSFHMVVSNSFTYTA
jgi:predicted sulfurtransferase